MRAERALDGGRHGHRVALGVDHREVGGRRRIRLPRGLRLLARQSRARLAHAACGVDEARALGKVCRVEQGLQRDRDEVAVCQEAAAIGEGERSEEHTSELQSLMRISYAVFCLKKKKNTDRI